MIRRFKSAWRWMMHPEGSLTKRALNAGAWAFALTLTVRGLGIIRNIVLARLLSPDDFGLMGIALLTLEFLSTFTTTGFDQALIQRSGDIREHLNAAWTVSILRGLLIGSIVVASAPVVASFFHTAAATPILRVMGASLMISGFKNVGVIYFDKELQFRQRFIFRSVPQLFDLMVAVTAAVLLKNVWALVLGVLARSVVMIIASYRTHPYRPRLVWDRKKMGDLISFGVWIFGSAVLTYFSGNLDDIIVGRVLGATMLGFYTMAYTLSSITSHQITGVVQEVAFPAFSKVQHDLSRLRGAYLRTLRGVSVLVFPVAAGLWFVGPQLVETFMGEKWLPLIPAFNVLLLWGLLRSVGTVTSPLLFAAGRPDINMKLHLVTVVLLAVVIYPFTRSWGIVGAAWATVAAGLLPVAYLLLLTGRFLGTQRWATLKSLTIPISVSGLMLVILFLVRSAGATTGPLLLVWAPSLGIVVYGGLMLVTSRLLGYDLRGTRR